MEAPGSPGHLCATKTVIFCSFTYTHLIGMDCNCLLCNFNQRSPKASVTALLTILPDISFLLTFKFTNMANSKNCLLFVVTAALLSLLSCTGPTKGANKSQVGNASSALKNDLEGAWELVSTTERRLANVKRPVQLKLFVDGYFCFIMKDSTGKWSMASGGTYETNGNEYKETHLYVTIPEYIGTTVWQQYEIKGDTLYKKLFKKAINSKGEDITAQFSSNIEEIRVRVKK